MRKVHEEKVRYWLLGIISFFIAMMFYWAIILTGTNKLFLFVFTWGFSVLALSKVYFLPYKTREILKKHEYLQKGILNLSHQDIILINKKKREIENSFEYYGGLLAVLFLFVSVSILDHSSPKFNLIIDALIYILIVFAFWVLMVWIHQQYKKIFKIKIVCSESDPLYHTEMVIGDIEIANDFANIARFEKDVSSKNKFKQCVIEKYGGDNPFKHDTEHIDIYKALVKDKIINP
ncbi:MAG: hypothetical protein HOK94_01185 [Candidatus Marinimicrobia bacterium]|jgi:hypothetical protein|nr:hypothetical protein [Candidatus Neomarinimicrobiota bacterium]